MAKVLSAVDKSKIDNFTIIGRSEDLLYYHLIFRHQFMHFISQEVIEFSDRTKILFFDLWSNGIVSRPISQYTSITQILEDYDIEAEICIEKGGGLWSKIKDYVILNRIQFSQCAGLEAFRRYQIPLFDLDKGDMVKIAEKVGHIPLLQETWSCWYPTTEGDCCRVCFACLARPKF